jgi:hypothetical protein
MESFLNFGGNKLKEQSKIAADEKQRDIDYSCC